MESEKAVNKDKDSEETQIKSEYTDFPCQECVYVANSYWIGILKMNITLKKLKNQTSPASWHVIFVGKGM